MVMIGPVACRPGGGAPTATVAMSPDWKHSTLTLADGGLTLSHASELRRSAGALDAKASGRYYFEAEFDALTAGKTLETDLPMVGVADYGFLMTDRAAATGFCTGHIYSNGGMKQSNGTTTSSGFSFAAGDRVGVDVDITGAQIRFNKNGGTFSSWQSLLNAGQPLAPIGSLKGANDVLKFYFDAADLAYSVPSGASVWSPNAGYTGDRWRIRPFGSTGGAMAFSEISMSLTAGGANACTGGTVSASSSYNASFTPDKALDGNTATAWASNGNASASWWQYQFASDSDINEVKEKGRTDANQSPTMQCIAYSSDGTLFYPRHWWNGSWTLGEEKTFTFT